MKTGKSNLRQFKNKGFTLIEVILIVVILGITAALIVSFAGPSLTGSPEVVRLVGTQYRVIREMEAINNEYRQRLANPPIVLNNFQNFLTARVYPAGIQATIARVVINIPGYGNTTQPVLSVTLRDTDSGQTVQAFFTQTI